MTDRHEESDDETYVRVGSAFEVLETPEDVQRAKDRKEKEQYVTDDKGRRRFHGAFTGGFSAGYFNTVGSKEGWIPSSFSSSRGKKAEYAQQRPEDYMDEEDLGVHGIAPREVSTRDEFTQVSGTKRSHTVSSQSSVIPGEPPLQNLIVPSRSTIGAQLLKAMGWREGEGVGPKVMKYLPKPQGPRVYGCAIPGAGSVADSAHHPKEAEGFLFAPRDVTPWQFEGKDDTHGIGYSGMEEQAVLKAQRATQSLYGMSGEAFGIGALEDEDEEEAVYGEESLTAYDAALAKEGDITMERKYGWTGGSESDSWSLESFVKALKPLLTPKRYTPPMVPRDFVPLHKFIAQKEKSSDSVTGKDGHHQKPLSSMQRSEILADTSGSVFSLLGAEGRERLKRATDIARQVAQGQPTSLLPTPPGQPTSGTSFLPTPAAATPPVPQMPLRLPKGSDPPKFSVENLKPFAHDPAKQTRYEAHIAGEADTSAAAPSNMTEWERQREREQFSRMAKVHQPLSTSLETRFTKPRGEGKDEDWEDEPQIPETDAVQAAKANMFGILTREVEGWNPHKILCKRFNVPDPYPSSDVVGVSAEVERTRPREQRSLQFLQTETITAEPFQQEQEHGQTERLQTGTDHTEQEMAREPSEPVGTLEASTTEKESIASEEAEEEVSRPPIDLFKAIFAESSSESEVSDMETETEQPSMTSQKSAQQQDGHSRNPSSSGLSVQHLNSRPKQWQDLSLVTTHSVGSTTTLEQKDSQKNRVPGHSQRYSHQQDSHSMDLTQTATDPQVSRDQLEGRQPSGMVADPPLEVRSSRDADLSSRRDSYGPPLPPPGAVSVNSEAQPTAIAESEVKKHSSHQKRSRHKHKHHKEEHRKEGHKHRKVKKEHHKSGHRHSGTS